MPVKDLALIEKYIKSSAWNAHSEAILLSLLVASEEDRRFAIDKIMLIRKDSPNQGDTRPRFRHNPASLNLKARTLQEMIEWDKEVLHEPYLTCSMNEEELEAVVLNGLEVPYFPVHGQAFERSVKLVTEAASAVAGWEKRDGCIRVRRTHRKHMSSTKSPIFSYLRMVIKL